MEPDEIIIDTQERMEKAVETFHNGLTGLRTGRATPGWSIRSGLIITARRHR